MKKCLDCGTEMEDDQDRCPSCGSSQTSELGID